MTPRVAVSYSVEPAMKREPSGEIDNTDDCPVTIRLLRTTPEAVSYTKSVLCAVVVVWLMATIPIMNCPSAGRTIRPGNATCGRPTFVVGVEIDCGVGNACTC